MFKYPNIDQVWQTGRWAEFLEGRATGFPAGKIERGQLRPPLEMESNIEILRRVVFSRNPTTTGQEIYSACKNATQPIHFIGWRMLGNETRPGFSSFDSDCPLPGEGTIYVNLDLCLQVLDPNNNNPNKILNGYIILLHELGHARHWLRFGSSRFASFAAKDNSRTQRVSDATMEIGATYNAGGANYVQGSKYTDRQKLIEAAVLNKVGHADYYGKCFPSELELLNWAEHEGPICDDWKIARRPAYTAIADHWGTTPGSRPG